MEPGDPSFEAGAEFEVDRQSPFIRRCARRNDQVWDQGAKRQQLVQIDNVNKVMSVAGSGSFQIGRRGPGDYITTGRGNFPAPITTIEEPYVFLRSDTGMMVCKYRVLGSPGAWTGFTVDGWFGGSFANLLYTVHWMVGSATPSGAEGDYGIRIRNGSGNGPSTAMTTSSC